MEATDGYKVKVGEFEGPLDLLLSLIEKRKLFINDISLSEVTDGYFEYLKQFEEFPLANTADFMIVASTLMLIKSISLLPGINLTTEEKESIQDLEDRLKIYQDIKDKSNFIKENFGKRVIFEGGLKKNSNEVFFMPTIEITKENLLSSIKDLINSFPKKEKIPETKIRKVRSLEETIIDLSKRIQTGLKMKFSEFARSKKPANREEFKTEKINIVVSFLAMLELVKRGALKVTQENHFEEIHLESNDLTTPAYGTN